jgi:hypothetical protein
MRNIPPKHRFIINPHGPRSQKTAFFYLIVVSKQYYIILHVKKTITEIYTKSMPQNSSRIYLGTFQCLIVLTQAWIEKARTLKHPSEPLIQFVITVHAVTVDNA